MWIASFIISENVTWVKQMVSIAPSSEMKDHRLQAATIRWTGSSSASSSGSDAAWRMGNLQFAGGIVSSLCLRGRIGARPGAAAHRAAPARGDRQRPCHHPPRAGAEAPGDTEEVLGQMSYIKWQVINSRWQLKTAVFLLVINSSGAWGSA